MNKIEKLTCKEFIESLSLNKTWRGANGSTKIKVSFMDIYNAPDMLVLVDDENNIYRDDAGEEFILLDPENRYVAYKTTCE